MAAEQLNENMNECQIGRVADDTSLPAIDENFNARAEVFRLNFSATLSVHRSFLQSLHQFKSTLDKKGIEVVSINMSEELKAKLANDGVLRMFNAQTQVAYKPPVKKPAPSIDVKFIDPFIRATTQSLKIQAKIESQPGKPKLKTPVDALKFFDIVGIISLVSNAFNGSIALCFKKSVFLQLCENMLGEEYDEITDELEDAAGELLNIIFGVAKAELNATEGYKIHKAIPTVLRGDKIKVKQTKGPTIILPFATDFGDFQIEIEAISN